MMKNQKNKKTKIVFLKNIKDYIFCKFIVKRWHILNEFCMNQSRNAGLYIYFVKNNFEKWEIYCDIPQIEGHIGEMTY